MTLGLKKSIGACHRGAEEPEEDYDLMNVIMIRRGRQTDKPIFDYLAGIFRCDKSKISEYVDIRNNEKVLREVEARQRLYWEYNLID